MENDCYRCKNYSKCEIASVIGYDGCLGYAWNPRDGAPVEVVQPGDSVEAVHPDVQEKDMVNGPSHYMLHEDEEIESIRKSLTHEEFNGYLKGNLKKYVDRCEGKGNEEQDLNKAVWHAMFLYMMNGGTLEGLRKTLDYMERKFSK